jgi:hypothetical protein
VIGRIRRQGPSIPENKAFAGIPGKAGTQTLRLPAKEGWGRRKIGSFDHVRIGVLRAGCGGSYGREKRNQEKEREPVEQSGHGPTDDATISSTVLYWVTGEIWSETSTCVE